MAEGNSSEIEFNSMVDVLKRLSHITYKLNETRMENNIPLYIQYLCDYYKEISIDLNKEEAKIWTDLKKLSKLRASGKKSQRWILGQLDEIDIKLRRLAKKKGYLTKQAMDKGQAIFDMG